MTITSAAQKCLDKITHGRDLVARARKIDEEVTMLALDIIDALDSLDLTADLDESFDPGEGKTTTLKLKRKSTGEVLVKIDGYHWVESLCLAVKQEVKE